MKKPIPIVNYCLTLMKLTLIQVVFSVTASALAMASPDPTFGQGILDKTITIKAENQKLRKILLEIEKSTLIKFSFNPKTIPIDKKMSVGFQNTKLSEVLNNLLEPLSVRYEVSGNYVILSKPTAVTQVSPVAQENMPFVFSVTGQVNDDTGSPLPGVNVIEKGSSNGTTTDADGRFSLDVTDNNATLVFSFIGFMAQEVAVLNQTQFNISLVTDLNTLGEVVVVGYGSTTKENLTGSIATVNSKEIMKSPVADVSNALVGRMAGLITKQTSGEPGGDGANFYIRGVGTNGVTAPLFVIDGIPREQRDFTQLSSSEIESVTILKDAASAAVFGSRAGNGVVLVTTKRGKAGQTNFNYSFNYGIQEVTRLPNYLGSYDYATLYNEALRNEGNPEFYTAEALEKFKDGSDPDNYPNTDWFKTLLRPTAPMVQHNFSVNGGSEKIKYFVSLGALDQEGLYENSNFKRYNFRSNIDAEITKSTHLTFDISGRSEEQVQTAYSTYEIFYQANQNAPTQPVIYQNGLYAKGNTGRNPAIYKDAGYERRTKDILLSTISLSQQLPFVPGLSIKGVAALDKKYDKHKLWSTPVTVYLKNGDDYIPSGGGAPSLKQNMGTYESVTLEAHLNYARTFGEHTFTGLFLYTQNKTNGENISAERLNFPTNSIDYLFAGSNGAGMTNNGGAIATGRRGYVGRITYNYKSRYLLEVNSRYDGSFNFPENGRWGLFPSISGGWVVSEENFMQNIPFINFLKLRGSWGKLGNDRHVVDGQELQFQFLERYKFGGGYVLGSTPTQTNSIYQANVPNPNITWETVTKSDIGLDAKFFEGKVGLETDYFYEYREDILGARYVSVPGTFGAILPSENITKIENKGFEVALSYEGRVSDNFNFFLRGNFTRAKNKVLFMDEPPSVDPNRQQTGRPLGTAIGYKALGLFQSQDEIANAPVQSGIIMPGDVRFLDVDGNDTINYDDGIPIGRSNIPQITYGISAGFNYKGIDFSMLWQGAAQVNQYLQETTQAFAAGGKVTKEHLDRWTPENPDASYPRLTLTSNNNGSYSSYWLENASYIRLKNIEIGYTLPKSFVQRIRLQSVRIYANGMNLLTFSDIKIVDPELDNYRGFGYPQLKVYNLGVNFQF